MIGSATPVVPEAISPLRPMDSVAGRIDIGQIVVSTPGRTLRCCSREQSLTLSIIVLQMPGNSIVAPQNGSPQVPSQRGGPGHHRASGPECARGGTWQRPAALKRQAARRQKANGFTPGLSRWAATLDGLVNLAGVPPAS